MSRQDSQRVYVRKVIITFLVGGLVSGVCFGWFITRDELRGGLFLKQGIFVSPTWRFWIFASLMFLLGQTGSWTFSYFKGWLTLELKPYTRFFLSLVLLVALPILLQSPILNVPIISSFLIAPILVASFISLALFGITGRWHCKAARWIVLVSFLITPLSNIPDAIMGPPMPIEEFEAVRFLIGSSLLSPLIGYWAVNSFRNLQN